MLFNSTVFCYPCILRHIAHLRYKQQSLKKDGIYTHFYPTVCPRTSVPSNIILSIITCHSWILPHVGHVKPKQNLIQTQVNLTLQTGRKHFYSHTSIPPAVSLRTISLTCSSAPSTSRERKSMRVVLRACKTEKRGTLETGWPGRLLFVNLLRLGLVREVLVLIMS